MNIAKKGNKPSEDYMTMKSELFFMESEIATCVRVECSNTSVILSKEKYVEILKDVPAWGLIIWGHPKMQNGEKKLYFDFTYGKGCVVDETLRSFGIPKEVLQSYLTFFANSQVQIYNILVSTNENLDCIPPYNSTLINKLYQCNLFFCAIGGSNAIQNIIDTVGKNMSNEIENRKKNPRFPSEDMDDRFDWTVSKNVVHTDILKEMEGWVPASTCYTNESSNACVLWMRRDKVKATTAESTAE